jgi:hypothetical protein
MNIVLKVIYHDNLLFSDIFLLLSVFTIIVWQRVNMIGIIICLNCQHSKDIKVKG